MSKSTPHTGVDATVLDFQRCRPLGSVPWQSIGERCKPVPGRGLSKTGRGASPACHDGYKEDVRGMNIALLSCSGSKLSDALCVSHDSINYRGLHPMELGPQGDFSFPLPDVPYCSPQDHRV